MNRICFVVGIVFLSIVIALHPSAIRAQSLEPRLYTNVPVGINFLLAGYAYSEGNILTSPASPVRDANSEINYAILAYARSIDVWGKSGKFDIVLPYAWLSAKGTVKDVAEERRRDVSGFVDPRFRFSVNLLGAPALSLEEFKSYKQDTILGVSLKVKAPFSQYDKDRLVNIGTNRWSFEPEVGVSKALGRWTFETAAAVDFFTKNDDFFNGKTLEQDPVYSVQGHVVYNFKSGIWASVSPLYYTGGETTVDGEEKNDRLRNWRVGATLVLPITKKISLKLYGSSGVSSRTGNDFDQFGIFWQYRWGGGF